MNEEKCRLTIGIIRRKKSEARGASRKIERTIYRPVRNEVLFYLLAGEGVGAITTEDEELAVTDNLIGAW